MTEWPSTGGELEAEQRRLGAAVPPPWPPPDRPLMVGACFVCFPRGAEGVGAAGDPAWAAAVVVRDGQPIASAVIEGSAGGPYAAGLLALREGPVLQAAVLALAELPDVLIVNATGRDHPRRCGLALHLGATLGLPSLGVTHRLLVAHGAWPTDAGAGALSPIRIDGEPIGYWLRTRAGARPLAVHAGWGVAPAQAVGIVRSASGRARTPEPLRQARRLARTARAKRAPAFERPSRGKVRRNMSTSEDKPPTGFPEPPGRDPGDISQHEDPHHALNTPVGEPDPTEWPDPYEQREDPRDPADPDDAPFGEQPHPGTGSTSTSEPHPAQDPEAEPWEGPKRDKVDE